MEVTASHSPKGTELGSDDSGALLVPGYKILKEELCYRMHLICSDGVPQGHGSGVLFDLGLHMSPSL